MSIDVKLKLNPELTKMMQKEFDQYRREEVLRATDYIVALASMDRSMPAFNYVVKDV